MQGMPPNLAFVDAGSRPASVSPLLRSGAFCSHRRLAVPAVRRCTQRPRSLLPSLGGELDHERSESPPLARYADSSLAFVPSFESVVVRVHRTSFTGPVLPGPAGELALLVGEVLPGVGERQGYRSVFAST